MAAQAVPGESLVAGEPVAVRPGRKARSRLQMSELNQAVYEFCVDVMGPDGPLIDGYPDGRPEVSTAQGAEISGGPTCARANSIEGGTSEVLRNILGERVLGLPGEPRLDRDLPWSQVRRS